MKKKPDNFQCKQCGNCCKNLFLGTITEEDYNRWLDEDREDILAWVSPLCLGENVIIGYDVWIHDEYGEADGSSKRKKTKIKKDKTWFKSQD